MIDRERDDITQAVMDLTGGRGANCVYDPVGGSAYTAASKCVAHEGRICLIGFASGQWGLVDPAHMVYQNYSVVGVIPSNYGRDYKEDPGEAPRLVAGGPTLRPRGGDGALRSTPAGPRAPRREPVQGKLVLGVHADATAP